MDTVVSPGSFEAALHAAGGAIAMVDALLGAEGAPAAASLHRPPGHHAEAARAMGFCLFDNVAIGAQHALDAHGARRVMIVDWDVHHGNGTNAIFHERDDVLFCSIHQWPLYPGTGAASDVGRGAGEGFTVNLPVPGGSGDDVFVSHLEHVVAPLARAYAPDLLLVSAGYDAHADDPLAGCVVTDAGYVAMAASVRAVADGLGIPLGIVLEGGYDLGGARALRRRDAGGRGRGRPAAGARGRAAPADGARARAPGRGPLAGARGTGLTVQGVVVVWPNAGTVCWPPVVVVGVVAGVVAVVRRDSDGRGLTGDGAGHRGADGRRRRGGRQGRRRGRHDRDDRGRLDGGGRRRAGRRRRCRS